MLNNYKIMLKSINKEQGNEMNTLKDSLLSIKGHLYERISSPFLLTFILVLMYCYWPIIFIAFDDTLDAASKIVCIQKYIEDFSISIDGTVYYYLFKLVICAMVSYAGLFILGIGIKEIQMWISKYIKKTLDSDYVNSKEYADILTKYEEQYSAMTNKMNKEIAMVQNLKKVIRLNDKERKAWDKLIDNDSTISIKTLTADEESTYIELHKKGLVSKSENDYLITSNYDKLKY